MFYKLYSVSRIVLCAILLMAILSAGQSPKQAFAVDTILALPFENTSGKPEFNWIGEGFSLTLADLLSTPGLIPLGVEERNLAYERLGLSPTSILTRATAIRLAEKAGANLLVIGTYNISGDAKSRTIAITARVIDLRAGRAIGNDYTFSGPISDLQTIQGKL